MEHVYKFTHKSTPGHSCYCNIVTLRHAHDIRALAAILQTGLALVNLLSYTNTVTAALDTSEHSVCTPGDIYQLVKLC